MADERWKMKAERRMMGKKTQSQKKKRPIKGHGKRKLVKLEPCRHPTMNKIGE
jgi:hypothetical protein